MHSSLKHLLCIAVPHHNLWVRESDVNGSDALNFIILTFWPLGFDYLSWNLILPPQSSTHLLGSVAAVWLRALCVHLPCCTWFLAWLTSIVALESPYHASFLVFFWFFFVGLGSILVPAAMTAWESTRIRWEAPTARVSLLQVSRYRFPTWSDLTWLCPKHFWESVHMLRARGQAAADCQPVDCKFNEWSSSNLMGRHGWISREWKFLLGLGEFVIKNLQHGRSRGLEFLDGTCRSLAFQQVHSTSFHRLQVLHLQSARCSTLLPSASISFHMLSYISRCRRIVLRLGGAILHPALRQT